MESTIGRGRLTGDAIKSYATAGRAVLTVSNPATGNRFTYRITNKGDGAPLFVSVLSGSDNDGDYRYIGFVPQGDDFIHGGRKSFAGKDAPSVVAFTWFWSRVIRGLLPESVHVHHEGRCGACGRTLTVPSSVESGIGPECARKLGRAA